MFMPKEPDKFDYATNLFYTALARANGITRSDVWLGHFSRLEPNQYQKRLFKALKRDEGFKRTPFQSVYPGQIAGLIKRISDSERAEYRLSDSERLNYCLDDSLDEAHVRFYADGAISCEIEPNRFRKEHYGKTVDGNNYLELLVQNNKSLNPDEKDYIIPQIEHRNFSELCAANEENLHYVKFMKGAKIIAGLTAYAVALRYQEIVEPLIGLTFLCATLLFGSARFGIYVNDALSKNLNNRNKEFTPVNTQK